MTEVWISEALLYLAIGISVVTLTGNRSRIQSQNICFCWWWKKTTIESSLQKNLIIAEMKIVPKSQMKQFVDKGGVAVSWLTRLFICHFIFIFQSGFFWSHC